MSKGSRIVPVRMTPELHDEMMVQIEMSLKHRKEEPWTVSEFIRTAIAEKLAKMARGRRKKGGRDGQ
jgi:hypothetical protein